MYSGTRNQCVSMCVCVCVGGGGGGVLEEEVVYIIGLQDCKVPSADSDQPARPCKLISLRCPQEDAWAH